MKTKTKKHRGKCYSCMRPMSSCMCKHTNPIYTNSRFIILMHPMEYRKEKNGTGHLTKLQLKNSETIVGVDFTDNERINQLLEESKNSCFLLYPGNDTFNLSVSNKTETKSTLGPNPTIFILDGTWACAKKMLKLSPNLQVLPRVSFDNNIQSKFIIKQQPESLCLSTIESIFTVLNLLKNNEIEQCDTTDFLLPFEKMIEYQVECIRNPPNESYRTNKSGIITTKNMYKKETERSIIFEDKSKKK